MPSEAPLFAFVPQCHNSTSFRSARQSHAITPRRHHLQPVPTRHAVAQRRRLITSASAAGDQPPAQPEDADISAEGGLPPLSEQLPEEVKEPTLLKWAEIPFRSIHEELDAIDEYEMQEQLDEADPWPKFLRGCAYEFWGQPKLALAQYNLTSPAAGLRQIPDLWERRGYNAFRIGEVMASNAYFDIAALLYSEAGGNEMHFMHWFYEHFTDYIPKRNGPPVALQRAICKYCVGALPLARDALVAQLADANDTLEHSILWLFAVSFRYAGGKLAGPDHNALQTALEVDFDWNPRMAKLITLYAAAAQNKEEERAAAELEVKEAIKSDGDKVDISMHLYLALYHDAFTGDTEERDRLLDVFDRMDSAPHPNDVDNYMFHAAKNRLQIPPSAKITEISEER